MAKLLKLRRGTTSQHSSFTGAEGEVTVDTDKEALVVHNGSTAGGFPVARADGTGVANFTITGELDAATLDISGNADVDGTLEADAYTVDGTALNEYIADTVGAMVTSNTETGITVTYEDGDNTLDFVVGTLNQNTTGTAANLSGTPNVTVGVVTAGSLDISGDADIDGTLEADAYTVNGTALDTHIAGVTVSNATNSATFTTTANNSTNETVYPVFVDGATGAQGAETDTGLNYNPSTGLLSTAAVTTTGNVVVGGNLQVDGTTTTVNSSTMTVTDKNIEIAKGAANDAAADGAGITVDSGDGDKTWNWVDATDSWTSSEHIHVPDNKKLTVGTGEDLRISHDGSQSYIDNVGTGNLYIKNDNGGTINLQTNGSENAVKCIENGSVEIYYDSVKKFETSSAGNIFTGKLSCLDGSGSAGSWISMGDSDDLQIFHDGSNSYIKDVGTGDLKITSDGGQVVFQKGTSETLAAFATDSGCELYHNNTKKIETTAAGVTVTGSVTDDKGDVRSIPSLAKSSAHTIAAANAGKAVYISTGGVTVPNSVMSAGDAVTIINNSGSDQTITQGSGVTLHNSADASTGNRTLAGRGMATVWFASASVAYISGAGLS